QVPHGEAGVVAIFFDLLAAGERPTVFGDGRNTRDYVHVADVVSATLAAQDHEGVFNVGTGVRTSDRELFELCRDVAGVDVKAESAAPRTGDLRDNVLDPGRARRQLAWTPRWSLADGLRHTWDWVMAKAD